MAAVGGPRPIRPSMVLSLILIVALLAGCLGTGDPLAGDDETTGTAYETRTTNVHGSGDSEFHQWLESPVLRGQVHVSSSSCSGTCGPVLAVVKPEHLDNATFTLEWSVEAGTVDEVRFFIGGPTVQWVEAVGPGPLTLTVDGDTWTDREAYLRIHPATSDPGAGHFIGLQWSIEGTLVEKVPLYDELEDEAGRGRGSNRH